MESGFTIHYWILKKWKSNQGHESLKLWFFVQILDIQAENLVA